METWEHFITEADTSGSDPQCAEAFIDAIRSLAKRYNKTTLLRVFAKATTDKGKELVRGVINNPSKSSSSFKSLVQSK